jgi:hypothetical protein
MPSPVPAPQIEFRPVAALKPYDKNARRHSRAQVRQIADSIRRFGFTNPVLITDDGAIVARHGRVMAAKELGMDCVPTLRLSWLAPDILRLVFDGRQHLDWIATKLLSTSKDLPSDWRDQRHFLGLVD